MFTQLFFFLLNWALFFLVLSQEEACQKERERGKKRLEEPQAMGTETPGA